MVFAHEPEKRQKIIKMFYTLQIENVFTEVGGTSIDVNNVSTETQRCG